MEYSVRRHEHDIEDEEDSVSSSSSDDDLTIMERDLNDASDDDNMLAENTKLTDLTTYEGKDAVQYPHGQSDVLSMEQKQADDDYKILKGIMQDEFDTTCGSVDAMQVSSEHLTRQIPDHSQSQEVNAEGDHQRLVHGQVQISQEQMKNIVNSQECLYNPEQEHGTNLVRVLMQHDLNRSQRSCSNQNDIQQDSHRRYCSNQNNVQAPVVEEIDHSINLSDQNKTQISQETSQVPQQPTTQNQNKNETLPLSVDQFHDKENREFVFFSWKDANELITLSWHLGHCKTCRETFKKWKTHAIKTHGAKPSVQKMSGLGSLQSKVVLQQKKGILTQNRSSNQQKTPAGNTSALQTQESNTSLPKSGVINKSQSNPSSKTTSLSGQYNCGLCNLQYNTEPELRAHLKVHAGQKIAFKCQKCDQIFLHQNMLQRHMADHSELKTTCKICGRKFPDARKARRHRYTHGKKVTFKCEKCSKTYTSMQSLRIHKRTHTGDGMMPCKFCGKKFPSKFSLTSHERIHTGEKPYKCSFCNERFKTLSAMRYHEQVHTGFRYMCQHCGKGYRDKSNLREHERTHTGEKPFKCDSCPKTFTTAALLKYHHRIHTGESYECQVCKKQYRSRGILNTHMKSHSDVRPFICRFCGKGFREKATLKTHEKGVHLGVKFTCKLCKREFTQKSALKTHEKAVHSLHGCDKIKKGQAGGQKEPPENKTTNNQTLQQSNTSAKSEISSGKQQTGTGYQGEQEYLNSTVIPLQIRQDHTYDSAAPHYPMSTSDFHTMVDSLIQFSKDH